MFPQPEPLSAEFAFVVRVRNHCAAGVRLALRRGRGGGRVLQRQGAEVCPRKDRALTARELTRIGGSGLLLNVLMNLTRRRDCPNTRVADMCSFILARVAARHVSLSSPEVLFVAFAPLFFGFTLF